ncbi:MAG: hypothetical protein ACW98Y_09635, partial [Candidatus Thorarchaeota archaeon]
DVKINDGAWSNNTITANVYDSSEGDPENFFYVIPAQADMTNITVVGRIRDGGTWHTGVPMVIRVRNSIASPTTTPPPTTTEDPLAAFMAEYGIWVSVAAIAVICAGGGGAAYKKGMIPGQKKKRRRRRKK